MNYRQLYGLVFAGMVTICIGIAILFLIKIIIVIVVLLCLW